MVRIQINMKVFDKDLSSLFFLLKVAPDKEYMLIVVQNQSD